MKIGIISRPNKKGQFVIPQKIREQFGIDENSSLNIIVKDNGFAVYPIKEIHTQSERDIGNEAFLKILEKTRGAWGPATKEDLKRERARRRLELRASRRRKQETW